MKKEIIQTSAVFADNDRLLKPAEAAPLLGRSVSSLAKDRVYGHGCPYIKSGRAVAYRLGDIRAFIESCRRTATNDLGAAA